MAAITRSTRADYDATNAIRSMNIVDVPCGVAIPGAGVPCTITSTGTVQPATSSDPLHGWSARDALVGEPVTLFTTARFHYADSGLTPGTPLYLSAAAGVLNTTAAGNPVAFAVTATDIIAGGVL